MFPTIKCLLLTLSIIAGIFVISTKNAIISVFNLIVLYILVAFYLIYIGITYLGISYIVVYIGAIAILFLFVIMMIDIEIVNKRNNNYLPLLFLLLGGFLVSLKNILFNLGIVKIKSLLYKGNDLLFIDDGKEILFNIMPKNKLNLDSLIFNDIMQSNYNIITKLDDENINMDSNSEFIYDDFSHISLNNNSYIMPSDFNTYVANLNNEFNNMESNSGLGLSSLLKNDFKENSLILNELSPNLNDSNYLMVIPDWDSAVSRISQISAIGDVLYTVYHSYIYIVSIILLLGMVGAIILTADHSKHVKIISIEKPKTSNILALLFIFDIFKYNYSIKNTYFNCFNPLFRGRQLGLGNSVILQDFKYYSLRISSAVFFPFIDIINSESKHSEGILGNLMYYIISNIFVGFLLLFINSSFSLSIKYLEKGGGFECGFTSFVQTRERYNIIFYRVSLLFLVFDLEIILAFPYPALYQKNQNNGKNNVLAFLYILIVGFIYELKEGALNIVKTAHSTDINIKN